MYSYLHAIFDMKAKEERAKGAVARLRPQNEGFCLLVPAAGLPFAAHRRGRERGAAGTLMRR